MNQKKSNNHFELLLETLEVIWIQQSGFLDRITLESGVNFYYYNNLIMLVGNYYYCQNAAQKIKDKIHDDFYMQIDEFRNNEETKLFHQLFYQPEYREISKNNRGFWIYTFQSLMKQYQKMEQQGYQSNFPNLPNYFIITWFPRRNMLYIQQQIFQMIGYQYNQGKQKEQFKFDKQYNITALEAISIYLILDVLEIMDQFQLKIELKQIPNQFFLVIKANSMNSVEEILKILENNLERKKFWPIAYLEIQLSSNDLFYLEKELNDQVRTHSGIKIHTYEDVIHESKRLDQQFDTNLNEILNQRFCSDELFIFGDDDKQCEITEKVIQIVRKLKQKNKSDLVETTSQYFYYQESSNARFQRNPKINQKQYFPFQNNSKNNYKDQFTQHDKKQFEQQSFQPSQNFAINVSDSKQTYYSQQKNTTFAGETFQQDNYLPLKDYKKHSSNYVKNSSSWKNYNQKSKRMRYHEQANYREQANNEVDVSLYVAKSTINQDLQNNYNFQYSQQLQEEEKSSELLITEDLNKLIQCQVIKIQLYQFQILYTQIDNKSTQKINFTEFKQSFEEFKQNYYNLRPEINLEFSSDSIKINVKFKQMEDINQIKNIFHKYFFQSMYYVTQYSTQALGLVEILKKNFKVEYFSTKTEQNGFLSEQQFLELDRDDDGQQMAIKISKYSYRHHYFLKEKFNNFEIQQSFYQNSSILDISKQGANSKKVIIISEDQFKYLTQNFPDLEACQLRKFKEYFKISFYFVQIEYIEEILEQAKEILKKMNEKYVKLQVQTKEKENKKVWIKEIRKEESYQVSKLYCYNIMEEFNKKLLNDVIDIQLNLEEYQANQNLSMYYEAIIELGNRELNVGDPGCIETLLFNSDFKYQPKIIKIIDLPQGAFITVWIRNQRDNLDEGRKFQVNEILPRGYIQKK
ncbi:unnamed protein product [Paramecium sonneborni]|uniref:Uncharacterized protein n=1 Tax=Paramecium sonneborni TaxID=65129 RepID=A0A8S1R340_9CILI|nr:unnamed protein product [Paramecium sonneborni]